MTIARTIRRSNEFGVGVPCSRTLYAWHYDNRQQFNARLWNVRVGCGRHLVSKQHTGLQMLPPKQMFDGLISTHVAQIEYRDADQLMHAMFDKHPFGNQVIAGIKERIGATD